MPRPSRISVFQWDMLTDQERDKIEVQELSKKVQDLVNNQPKLFQPITFVLPSWFNDKRQLEINQVTTEDKRNWLQARIAYLTATINLNHQKCWGYQKGADYCKRENNEIAERGKLQRELNDIGAMTESFEMLDFLPSASAEEDPSIYSGMERITVTPGALTWYYVKKPSGVCERMNVSQKFVNQMTSQGWVFSLTDICATPSTDHVTPQQITRCYMVHGKKLELTEQAVGYYINQGVTVTPCSVITQPPVEPEPEVTTDHVVPPEMPVEEPPMVTPTEPGQVNWIPEPFFSFINNVFRK